MKTTDLNGSWEIRPTEAFRQGFYPRSDGWTSIQVPGHWQQHSQFTSYVGKMVYQRRFRAEPLADRRYWLRLNGIFYWSRPFLNGVDLGQHEGYFAPQEHDVTTCLQRDNLLVVEVDCPDEHEKVNKRLITGVFSHWDCLDPQANPGGIWLPVELIETGQIRLVTARCQTEQINEQSAGLRYTLVVDCAQSTTALIEIIVAPHNFAGTPQTFRQRVRLQPGRHTVDGELELRNPRLWWSHDLGDPNLYQITARVLADGLVSDEQQFLFGLRQFELRNWIAHLNGKRLLIKGNNYAPGDTRIASMTYADYVRDIGLAINCHLNLLRVHAHIEHPGFYRAADEAGLLVWQDFPLQWHYRREVLKPARQQALAMVDLLANHPSIVVWCMHNEPVYLVDTKDESIITRARTLFSVLGFNWNRDVLDSQLKQVVQRADSTRPVVRSSGEYYLPGISDGGDGHFYFGWYLAYGHKRRFDELRRRSPHNIRFVTEFGAQSFPNLESCARFMPTDIAEIDVAQLTDRHHFQPKIMANWYDWRSFDSLAELVRYSQEYQSEINRYYIDRLRYHKYRPTGGIVPFMFNDSNPAVQWSVVDYWRIPKSSYFALRLAFSPRYIFTLLESDYYQIGQPITIPIYVVNDSHQPLDQWPVAIRLSDPAGTILAQVERTVSLEADCLPFEIDRLRLRPEQPGRYLLELSLGSEQGGMQQRYTIEVGDG